MRKIFVVGSLMLAIASGRALALPEESEQTSSARVSPALAQAIAESADVPPAGSQPVSPSLEVVSLGAEPRQLIRFTPVVGTEQQSVITMTMQMGFSLNGENQPAFDPPGTMTVLHTVVTDVNADGNISVDFEYSDVDVTDDSTLPPEAMETVRSQLMQLEGVKGTVVFDSRGNTQSMELHPPENSDASDASLVQNLEQMTRSLQQVSNPFPAEPIGIGAVWRVPQVINVGGTVLTQTATYELISHQENMLELAVSIDQQGDTFLPNLLDLPENIEPTDQSLSSTGSGRTIIDLNKMMPVSTDWTSTTQSTLTLSGGERSAVVDVTVMMDLLIVSDEASDDVPDALR